MAQPRLRLDEIVFEYHRRGDILYGKKEDGTKPTEEERESAKRVRRIIERNFPDIREREKLMYGDVYRSRNLKIPRVTVELVPGSYAGKLSYPDGSWSNYATFNFSNRSEMRDVIARLVMRGIIDVDTTKVVIGGSARPLLTLMAE
jgi:muconolactone delta-isomerase